MNKVFIILAAILVTGTVFSAGGAYPQGSSIDYKQLMAKCNGAIKQARSYDIKMGSKSSFTINSQENKGNSDSQPCNRFNQNHRTRFVLPDVIYSGNQEDCPTCQHNDPEIKQHSFNEFLCKEKNQNSENYEDTPVNCQKPPVFKLFCFHIESVNVFLLHEPQITTLPYGLIITCTSLPWLSVFFA